jgi:hypothetical protein
MSSTTNTVSPEELANALAVASRLSATEMRDLHALLLKGGEDVLKQTTIKRTVASKRKGKKKLKKKRRTNVAIVKPKKINTDEGKVVYQAWPAKQNSGHNINSPFGNTNAQVKVNQGKDIHIKMSELGLRQHGASVAVADTFAREAFGETFDNIETKVDSSNNNTENETAEEEDEDNTKPIKRKRRIKKRKKKTTASSKVMVKW